MWLAHTNTHKVTQREREKAHIKWSHLLECDLYTYTSNFPTTCPNFAWNMRYTDV